MEQNTGLHTIETAAIVEAVVRAQNKIKALYEEQDALIAELVDRMDAWKKLFEVDGVPYLLKDAHAEKNSHFHATVCRRFSLVEATKKDLKGRSNG